MNYSKRDFLKLLGGALTSRITGAAGIGAGVATLPIEYYSRVRPELAYPGCPDDFKHAQFWRERINEVPFTSVICGFVQYVMGTPDDLPPQVMRRQLLTAALTATVVRYVDLEITRRPITRAMERTCALPKADQLPDAAPHPHWHGESVPPGDALGRPLRYWELSNKDDDDR